jgi:hypothetical protein
MTLPRQSRQRSGHHRELTRPGELPTRAISSSSSLSSLGMGGKGMDNNMDGTSIDDITTTSITNMSINNNGNDMGGGASSSPLSSSVAGTSLELSSTANVLSSSSHQTSRFAAMNAARDTARQNALDSYQIANNNTSNDNGGNSSPNGTTSGEGGRGSTLSLT